MSQPGWYADPTGSGQLRWWDGVQWTSALQAPSHPVPKAPGSSVAVPSDPDERVVQGRVSWGRGDRSQVFADATGVTYGGQTMRWSEVEWFGYSVTRSYVQHTALSIKLGKPEGTGSRSIFTVGRGPYRKARGVPKGQAITISFVHADSEAHDETWAGLVDLLRRYLQPRLQSQILESIRAGRQVDMAGEYTVDTWGLKYPRLKRAYGWSDIEVVMEGGQLRLRPIGRPIKEGMRMEPAVPNVLLIPEIHAELTSRR